MLQRFREWFAHFMVGRYGTDGLNRFLSASALVLLIISTFTRIRFLYWFGLAALILCYFRMFSFNREKRYAENILFYNKTQKIRTWWLRQKNRMAQRRTHRFYRCPRCRQELRVPKGRGRIEITCPKCRAQFVKKS